MGNLFFQVSFIAAIEGIVTYNDPEVQVVETGWVARCATSPKTTIELRWRFHGYKQAGTTKCGWEPTVDGLDLGKVDGLLATWEMLKPAVRWQVEQKLLREYEGRGAFAPTKNEQKILDEGGYMWPNHSDSFGTLIWAFCPVR